MTSYQPFAIKKLFDIHPTKAYKLTNSKLFDIDGKNPVATNTSENHGRAGFSNLPPTEKNIITFSDKGTKSPDTFFTKKVVLLDILTYKECTHIPKSGIGIHFYI